MQRFSDKEIILNSMADEKNLCRTYASFAAEVTDANLRSDFCKISQETAELTGKLREEMKKRSQVEEPLATAERKNSVFKEFSHLNPLD